jgi:phenylacetate-coenzyme A ligase PaaK-like adenylate-forming protein
MQLTSRVKFHQAGDGLVRRNPLFYSSAARLLRRFDTLDARAQEQWRAQRLQRTLRAAARTPYGRSVATSRSLAEWPVLEKEVVRKNPAQFHHGSGWFTLAASTSGTTGTPLSLRRSLSSVAYEQAVIDHFVERSSGLSLRRCRAAVLRGDDIKPLVDREPPFWRLANGGHRLMLSANHLDESTLPHYLDALRRYAPDILFAYPSALESLCTLMLKRGDQLRIATTECASEALAPMTSEIAKRVLGTRVLAHYGQAERVAWAQGSPEDGYRFVPTYSVNELRFVESVDDADIYELIGTGLWNEAMPLIRYRTGDHVRLRKGSDPEAVASGRESFLSVIGRSDDYLIGPSGARLIGINHIPRGVPNLIRAQFVQESPEAVTLLVVPAPGFGEGDRRLLLEQAARKLPPSMRVRIETTNRLRRNASGKTPLVVNDLVEASPGNPPCRTSSR